MQAERDPFAAGAAAELGRLLLEADDDKFDAVLKDAVKTAKKVEPDFEIEL